MNPRDKTARFRRPPGAEISSDRRMFSLPLRPGEIVGGKYEITGVVGEGAMGAVYRGRHVHFQREVAIKVLHPLLSRDRVMVRRFEREAQAAGRIGSEHIVKLLDAGTFAAGERYIVMEYLEGESLAARLDRLGTLPAAEVCAIALQLLDGLACAHDARYVHRDLKPSNVFLVGCYEGRNDFVKILDFGVSKLNAVDAGDVTQTGVLLGTPHFMAPELMRGARYADHRSDLYALGVIMFRCITGLTPFVGATAYELLHKIAYEDVPRLRTFAPDVDEGFAAIVDRALVRDPDHRFADARVFAAALRAWSEGNLALGQLQHAAGAQPASTRTETGRASRLLWLLSAASMVVATGAVVLSLQKQRPVERPATSWLARAGESSAAQPRSKRTPEAAEPASADAETDAKTKTPAGAEAHARAEAKRQPDKPRSPTTRPRAARPAVPPAASTQSPDGHAPEVGDVSF
jgi:serine/threonine protein kinase